MNSSHPPASRKDPKKDPLTSSQKKGKDPRKQPLPSAASAPSSSILSALHVKLQCEKDFLRKRRQELRPLLNSIRLAESKNCAPSHSSDHIGPFHISRQYHSDAWKQAPTFASATSWSRCRDLRHAENTVVAYWLKYCPEAVETHDFEVLTKVHNGGLYGEKTESYWSQVSKYLKEEETTKMKEKVLCERSPMKSRCKVELPRSPIAEQSKLNDSRNTGERSPSPLSSIITNTVSMHKTLRNGYNKLSWATASNKLIQNMKPRFFHPTTQQEGGKLKENVSPTGEFKNDLNKCSSFGVNKEDRKSAQKRVSHVKYFQSKAKVECVPAVRHRFATPEHSKLSEDFRKGKEKEESARARAREKEKEKEKAVMKLQAFWRMRCVRKRYRRLHAATLLIQKMWRTRPDVFSREKRNSPQTFQDGNKTEGTDSAREECIAAEISACELLYKGNISPFQEDALLSELVKLFEWEREDTIRESCHGFQFPQPIEDHLDEVCTPKMKLDTHFTATPPCTEATPLIIKEALPSPFMEKEIINELAKLFPRRLHLTPHEDMSPENSNSFEDTIASITVEIIDISQGEDGNFRDSVADCSTADMQHVESNHDKLLVSQVESNHVRSVVTGNEDLSPVNQSADRPVESDHTRSARGIDSSGNEEGNLRQITILDWESPDWHVESDQTRTRRSCPSVVPVGEEEEDWGQIAIPLLQDQSPVMKSKARQKKIYQNPCTLKVEKALVSSLSSWQGSRLDASMDKMSPEGCERFNLSETLSMYSIDASKSQCDMEQKSKSTKAVNDLHPHFVLETDTRNSTVYAKAIFQCMSISIDGAPWLSCGKSLAETSDGIESERSTIIPRNQVNPYSIQHLCMLWEKHNVDLLTRSLKYKSLQAMECTHQPVLYMTNVSPVEEVLEINAEILKLERLGEETEKGDDLILHQRNTIYSNIAAYSDMEERHKLYRRWGIEEKLFSGRLKKIVYELLWKDPDTKKVQSWSFNMCYSRVASDHLHVMYTPV